MTSQRLEEVYRGHKITLTRESCMGGWEQLYYSIFREADGYECTVNFTTDESPLPVFMGHMRDRVDAELAEADPWGEAEEEGWGYRP